MSAPRSGRPHGGGRGLALLVAGLLGLAAAAGPALGAPRARVSFTDIQQSFMCTACHEALNVARSPEAYGENAYLRGLIAKGEAKPQIVHDMVAQYGAAVLAKPPAHGFASLVYIVPAAVVAAALVALALVLAGWRGRGGTEDGIPAMAPSTPLSDADARRLEAELAREA